MSAALVVVAALLAAPLASLDEAEAAYRELRYDEAAQHLEELLAGEALDGEARLDALALYGVVEIIRGHDEEGRGAFRALLSERPDARLPAGLSPKITSVFEEVRSSLAMDLDDGDPAAPTPAAHEPAPLVDEPARPPPVADGDDDGVLSPVALGVAAGAALGAAVIVAGIGALLVLANRPPDATLGTMQLP